MMADAAIAYKKKYNVPIVMYCLDLWPESLIAGGIKRDSYIYKVFQLISKRIYRQMDKIFITSRMFSNYLNSEFDIDLNKMEYLPQYAEGLFEKIPVREEDGIFNFMFAGNIGSIQSVDTIIKAAEELKDEPVRFHIVGSGIELERIQEMSKDLNNVIFYGRRPVEDMPILYEKADAMLVTLASDPVLSLTLPGKVQSYMAVGKPIIGAIDGETMAIIKEAKCGFCGEAEDVRKDSFVTIFLKIIIIVLLLFLFVIKNSFFIFFIYLFFMLTSIKFDYVPLIVLGASNYIPSFLGLSPLVYSIIMMLIYVIFRGIHNRYVYIGHLKKYKFTILVFCIWCFITSFYNNDYSFFNNFFMIVLFSIIFILYCFNTDKEAVYYLKYIIYGMSIGIILGLLIQMGVSGFSSNHPFRKILRFENIYTY